MADPIRTALERLVARLDETTDCNGPIPAWSDSYYAARAALSQPEPEGPTLDDIYELCEEYEFILADGTSEEESTYVLWEIARAVLARWNRPAPQPIPVSERLPEPETKVLAHYFNDLGNGRTICAIWVPAKTHCDSTGDDDFTEYDEDEDKFYWPEGWYEAIENWDDFGWVKVNEGEVVYWQPLPQWPALPLPSGEV